MAEAGYVYTATKSKAEMPALSRVTVWVSDAVPSRSRSCNRNGLLPSGHEYRANGRTVPANHATPTLIGEGPALAKGMPA